MYERVLRDIPEFVLNNLIYCETFIDQNKRRSCMVLTKSLEFLEFGNKKLSCSISLRHTILQSLAPQIQVYNGPKSKCYTNVHSSQFESTAISFHKYMFQNFNIQRVYILVQCWDHLVVLHRLPNSQGFHVISECKKFVSLQLKHGKLKFCPIIELRFSNGNAFQTDFQLEHNEICTESPINQSHLNKCTSRPEFMRLLETYCSAKAELFIEKEQTARMFKRLHHQCSFGIPTVRSLQIEEKQILARCGDVWKRFTPYNYLVIGIPLMNQCLPPNLTILYNIKPVFKFDQRNCHQLQYQHKLYQLKTTFDRLDSIEAFLDAEQELLHRKDWVSVEQLLPATFAVLLIKLLISEIVNLEKCSLIISYEIRKNVPPSFNVNDIALMPIELQLQIPNIDLHEIFHVRGEKYKITFNETTLQQDILSIVDTSIQTSFNITFDSPTRLKAFSELLLKKFNFKKYHLSTANLRKVSDDENTAMEFDYPESFANICMSTDAVPTELLFYNSIQNCLWFGCLVLCYHNSKLTLNDSNKLMTIWKFYHPTQQKAWHFFKILFDDLTSSNIENFSKSALNSITQFDFENNLRLEFNSLAEYCKVRPALHSAEWYKFIEVFSTLQMKTDIIFKKLHTK